jgi:putative flippase GtrA
VIPRLITRHRLMIVQLTKFLLVGLPAFILAVPLNYLLVEEILIGKGISYALVLILQVSINFFMCRWLIFTSSPRPWYSDFGGFVIGILGIRCLDWGVYWLLVQVFGFYYILIQLINVLVFSLAKFLFAKRILT